MHSTWGSRVWLDILKSMKLREIEFHDAESMQRLLLLLTLVAEAALESQLETLLQNIKVTLVGSNHITFAGGGQN